MQNPKSNHGQENEYDSAASGGWSAGDVIMVGM